MKQQDNKGQEHFVRRLKWSIYDLNNLQDAETRHWIYTFEDGLCPEHKWSLYLYTSGLLILGVYVDIG